MQDTESSEALLRAVQPFNQESPESESDMNTPNCFVEQLGQCVDC